MKRIVCGVGLAPVRIAESRVDARFVRVTEHERRPIYPVGERLDPARRELALVHVPDLEEPAPRKHLVDRSRNVVVSEVLPRDVGPLNALDGILRLVARQLLELLEEGL